MFFCHRFGRLKALTKLAWESFLPRKMITSYFLLKLKKEIMLHIFLSLHAPRILYLLATARKSNADSFL